MTIPSVTLGAVSFGTGDKLDVDWWLHVSTNTSATSVDVGVLTGPDSTHANLNAYVTTPGYTPSFANSTPLTASDGASADRFGFSTALTGQTDRQRCGSQCLLR